MFINPAPKASYTSKFGFRNLFGTTSFHQGIDLAQKGDVPILASADGIVMRVGSMSTYGNIIILSHSLDGIRYDTLYAHLRDGSTRVKKGERIKQGQVMAFMGSTGRSTGQHLHFEIHKGAWSMNGTAQDPWPYINALKVKDVSDRIKYKIDTNPKHYRIQSGAYNTKAQMENALNAIKKSGILTGLYTLAGSSDKEGWRFRTGTYPTKALAVAKAEQALRAGEIGLASILGQS